MDRNAEFQYASRRGRRCLAMGVGLALVALLATVAPSAKAADAPRKDAK